MEERNEQPIQVLIIEDDVHAADSMCIMLEEFGFTIKGVAYNLETALSFLNREQFDIALVDIHLNGSNSGIEIGKLINSLYRLPFIFITGLTDKAIVTEAVKANPAAYLVKPPNPASLFACIQTAIQNFNNQQVGSLQSETTTDFFFIKIRNKLKKIYWNQIVLLSAAENYTLLTLEDKTEYFVRSSLAMTLKFQIPNALKNNFLQVNRSEAVQIQYISEIQNEEISTPIRKLTITKAYIKEVKQRLNILN